MARAIITIITITGSTDPTATALKGTPPRHTLIMATRAMATPATTMPPWWRTSAGASGWRWH